MRVLVIGASGFIGQYLVRRLDETLGHEVFGTFRSRSPGQSGSWRQAELTDDSVLEGLFGWSRPDAVVHLAAIADVGTCEREPSRATAVNVAATSSIARLCHQWGARLVFVSTEYVFDGQRGFYDTKDIPRPQTHYGLTKWQAEREVANLAADWCVVRTSIVYGWPALGGRNFVPWLIERLGSGLVYEGSPQVLRTPVYVEHLVDGIAALVEGEHQGVHHVAGQDWVSMHDFALAVANGFELDRGLIVSSNAVPIGNKDTESRSDTSSPASDDRLGLDSTETMQLLGLPHPGISEGIVGMREEHRIS